MKKKTQKEFKKMSKRRMFLCEILQSDDFFTLPIKCQMLYIHLNMAADDDGLLGNAQSVAKYLGISKKNIDILIEKGYIISFDSGVTAITHWHLNNKIRKDRYTETRFVKEHSALEIRNNIYKKIEESETAEGIAGFFDNQNATQGKARQERKEEDSLVHSSVGKSVKSSACGTDARSDGEKLAKDIAFSERLSYEERKSYNNFLKELQLFYLKEYGDTLVTSFIEEYEKQNWLNLLGEDVRKNYKPELKKWRAIKGF